MCVCVRARLTELSSTTTITSAPRRSFNAVWYSVRPPALFCRVPP